MPRDLDAEAFAPYGRVLDLNAQLETTEPRFVSAESAFAHASLFDPGEGGTVELLWVTYDRVERPDSFEAHRLTEQALIPITGSIVQHVFRPDHQDGRVESFLVESGQGIVMDPDCFHTTTSVAGRAVCLMVTRASTTRDLADSLHANCDPTESVYSEAK